MWEIFKKKKGKDFYRDSIAFFAYDPDNYIEDYDEDYVMDDDEISYHVSKKIKNWTLSSVQLLTMEEIVDCLQKLKIKQNNNLIEYVLSLQINNEIKRHLVTLIENDSYDSYIDIYNICLENDIELPPIWFSIFNL